MLCQNGTRASVPRKPQEFASEAAPKANRVATLTSENRHNDFGAALQRSHYGADSIRPQARHIAKSYDPTVRTRLSSDSGRKAVPHPTGRFGALDDSYFFPGYELT